MIEGARDCFVISPFGLKKGELNFDDVPVQIGVDFDVIYEHLIAPAITAAGLKPIRGDKVGGGKSIYNEMFRALAEYPYALVDCTFLNPNVYYELGIRHALNPSVTIAIQALGASIPFDLKSVPFHPYRLTPAGGFEDLAGDVAKLTDRIATSRQRVEVDSPVHNALDEIQVGWRRGGRIIKKTETVEYDYAAKPDFKIGYKTGDLRNVENVDAWVNSENDYLEMSRVIERSISATIRHMGATVDKQDDVIRDYIHEQLTRKKRKDVPRVKLGAVFDTGPGRLGRAPHNVKRLFHAVTVTGTPGKGFKVGDAIEHYVERVLSAIEEYNGRIGVPKLRSVLVPMIGSGQAQATPESVASVLVEGAVNAVRKISSKNRSTLRSVYFLVYSTRELAPLERALEARVAEGTLSTRNGPAAATIA